MILKYITIISGFNYLVFALVGLFRKTPLRRVNLFLGVLFLLMSAYSFLIYYYDVAFEMSDQRVLRYYLPIDALMNLGMGPLFLFYVSRLLKSDIRITAWYPVLFIATFIPALSYIMYLAQIPVNEKINLLLLDFNQGIWQTKVLNAVFYFQMTFCLIVCFRMIRRQYLISDTINFDSIVLKLDWIRSLVLIDLFVMLITLPLSLLFPAGKYTNIIAQLAMDIQLIYLFWKVMWQNGLFASNDMPVAQTNEFAVALLPEGTDGCRNDLNGLKEPGGIKLQEDLIDSYKDVLTQYLLREKPYLSEECTMQHISNATGISLHHLSCLLNNYIGKNFSDYMNEFRIDEAKKMLLSGKYSNQTIETLGYDCGFGSKSNFNKVFKKSTGMTPSEFRKTVKN